MKTFIEKERETKEEQRDKLLDDLKCSKCGSHKLELKFERNLHTGYIRCNNLKISIQENLLMVNHVI